MLVGITVGAFFIPDGDFNAGEERPGIRAHARVCVCGRASDGGVCLLPVWYYFGVVGSFIFIIIQLILLVDFAHSWNLAWLQNAEDGNRKCWFGGEGAAPGLGGRPVPV